MEYYGLGMPLVIAANTRQHKTTKYQHMRQEQINEIEASGNCYKFAVVCECANTRLVLEKIVVVVREHAKSIGIFMQVNSVNVVSLVPHRCCKWCGTKYITSQLGFCLM